MASTPTGANRKNAKTSLSRTVGSGSLSNACDSVGETRPWIRESNTPPTIPSAKDKRIIDLNAAEDMSANVKKVTGARRTLAKRMLRSGRVRFIAWLGGTHCIDAKKCPRSSLFCSLAFRAGSAVGPRPCERAPVTKRLHLRDEILRNLPRQARNINLSRKSPARGSLAHFSSSAFSLPDATLEGSMRKGLLALAPST